jgi:type II secretory pathway pseudopilin PulG
MIGRQIRKPRRGAFTLIELLGTLIIFIGVLALSTSVIVTAVKTIGNANAHMAQARSLDSAIALLRQDVWASSKIEQTDRQTLVLHNPDGAQILWTLTAKHDLQRLAGPGSARPRTFAALPEDLTLTAAGSSVRLQSKDASGRDALVSLPSQLLIAGDK